MAVRNSAEITVTKGWKGYVGAIGCIILGIYLIIIGEKIAGSQLIFIGLALLGIRHKQDYSSE